EVAACHQWETIETTGAGDTFFGIALSKVLDIGMENLNRDILKNILEYANVGAAIITSRKGAMTVMPEQSEIEACMNMK
ncbi:MAG: carbohydrate kinase, partial [Frisingicoccus sp.]